MFLSFFPEPPPVALDFPSLHSSRERNKLTAWVVTGSQQNTTSGLSLADEIARSRSTQEAILADKQLLDTMSSTDLGDLLDDFGVEISTITANDEESSVSTLWNREDYAGDERFGVMRLLEDGDLLTKT